MFKLSTLDNGLRVATASMPEMSSVSLGVWAGVGSRYEPKDLAGVSHFLEHLLFKGTKKRTAKQITQEIEGLGGNINAFTSEEHTCYTVKIHASHWRKGLEILSDMILHSALDEKEVDRERNVILEEMNMSRDNPMEYVQELLTELLWPNHPMGRMILGEAKTIQSMRRTQILAYKDEHYVAQNLVVSAAGNLRHEDLLSEARKTFGKARHGLVPSFESASQSPVASKAVSRALNRKTEQAHLAVAFPALSRTHADKAVLRIANVILGENMSSRLFQEVREKRGFAYDINSSVHFHHDTGSLVVYAGTERSKLKDCLATIGRVLQGMAVKGVTEQELKHAKEYRLGGLSMGLEKTMERMLWLGEHVSALQELPDLKRTVSEIQQVKSQDILRVAKSLLRPEACRVQAIGKDIEAASLLRHLDL